MVSALQDIANNIDLIALADVTMDSLSLLQCSTTKFTSASATLMGTRQSNTSEPTENVLKKILRDNKFVISFVHRTKGTVFKLRNLFVNNIKR